MVLYLKAPPQVAEAGTGLLGRIVTLSVTGVIVVHAHRLRQTRYQVRTAQVLVQVLTGLLKDEKKVSIRYDMAQTDYCFLKTNTN